jgi:endonuclease/exonuclease/phosphatase (EEP) superfamily protein YafD
LIFFRETSPIGFQGPVVFAGDFNTNSADKTRCLEAFAGQLGLRALAFQPDGRTLSKLSRLPLDHAFVRGLAVLAASAPDVPGSDHQPLVLRLAVKT